eukprot:6935944-Prymnesium_polylepis.1
MEAAAGQERRTRAQKRRGRSACGRRALGSTRATASARSRAAWAARRAARRAPLSSSWEVQRISRRLVSDARRPPRSSRRRTWAQGPTR